MALDLDAYLHRIGYAGPRDPTLAVLRDLHRLHPAAIAFENIGPLMGQVPSLDIGALQAKLVDGGRGGYCYEHNTLFRAALEALGFEVTGLGARVRWNMPDTPIRARTHMSLRVELPEGSYLADVGFGGLVMTGPLRLETGPAQETPHETFRLHDAGGGQIDLQVLIGGDWRNLLRFDLTVHLPVDYEPMNWFSGAHPQSIFLAGLMAARALPDRRLSLANGRYTVRKAGAAAQETTLASMDQLIAVLREDFGVAVPQGFAAVGPKIGL